MINWREVVNYLQSDSITELLSWLVDHRVDVLTLNFIPASEYYFVISFTLVYSSLNCSVTVTQLALQYKSLVLRSSAAVCLHPCVMKGIPFYSLFLLFLMLLYHRWERLRRESVSERSELRWYDGRLHMWTMSGFCHRIPLRKRYVHAYFTHVIEFFIAIFQLPKHNFRKRFGNWQQVAGAEKTKMSVENPINKAARNLLGRLKQNGVYMFVPYKQRNWNVCIRFVWCILEPYKPHTIGLL